MAGKPECECRRFASCDPDEPEHVPSVCPVHPMPTLHWLTKEDAVGPGYRVWREWLYRHGIDRHNQIALDMPIIRNVDEKQVVVVEYWEPAERRTVDPNDNGRSTWFERDSYKDCVYRARVVQLDFEPEPFPFVTARPGAISG